MKKGLAVLVTLFILLTFPGTVFADDDVGDSPWDSALEELLNNIEIATAGKEIKDLSDGSDNTILLIEIVASNGALETGTMYIVAPNNFHGRPVLDADWNELNNLNQEFTEETGIVAPNNLFGFVMIIAPNNFIAPNNIIALNNIVAPNN